jgi:hypothetical protein
MSRKLDADRRPGKMPQISAEGTSLLFAISVRAEPRNRVCGRLLLRCDDNGEVWASLETAGQPVATDDRS